MRKCLGIRHNNTGVTLAELCVVMALISILTVMTSSFCIITQSYTAKVSADNDVKISIENVEKGLSIWISSVDSEDYSLKISDDRSVLYAVGNNEEWTLQLVDNKLVGTMPTGAFIDFELPRVEFLSFSFNNYAQRSCFVSCQVNYSRPGNTGNESTKSITVRRLARVAKEYDGE